MTTNSFGVKFSRDKLDPSGVKFLQSIDRLGKKRGSRFRNSLPLSIFSSLFLPYYTAIISLSRYYLAFLGFSHFRYDYSADSLSGTSAVVAAFCMSISRFNCL